MKLFSNLSSPEATLSTPDPLPLLREGGVEVRGGFAPSQKSLLSWGLKELTFLKGGGIVKSKRGEASLLKLISPPLLREGDKVGSQENRRFFWVLKGGGLINFLPLPLDKGKGIKGIGFPKQLQVVRLIISFKNTLTPER